MAKAKAGKTRKKKISALAGGSKVAVERFQLVEKMLISRYNRRDIVRACMEKFSVSKQTAYSYYDTVVKEWQDTTKESRNLSRFKACQTLDRSITGAIADRKWSAVARLVEVQAKLLGLNEPDEVLVHAPDSHPTETMTTAELRAYIAEKREKRESLLEQVVSGTAPVH